MIVPGRERNPPLKLRNEITIEADRETVWRTFDDPDYMTAWQPTLKSFTHKEGPRGEPGQVAELVYDENGREVVLTERLTEKREPDFMAGIYESDWGFATIVNHFDVIGEDRTRWTMYANHDFKGVAGFLSFLFRRSINARTEDWMQRFKLLVETEIARRWA